jgi:hypothetical protein
MNTQKIISKLNLRHVALYFVAFWFFLYAFKTLSSLRYLKLVEVVRSSNENIARESLIENGISSEDLANSIISANISALIGLILGLGVALFLAARRKLFWGNPFIAFVVILFLNKLGWLAWDYLKALFWYPGQQINNLFLEFLINGIILLLFGIIILYITGKKKPTELQRLATV